MSENGSIAEFFYNIVPGVLFVFLLILLVFNFDAFEIRSFFKHIDSAFIIFGLVIIGLFLGFVFQSFTKFARGHLGWNKRVTNYVLNQHDTDNLLIFKDAYIKLQKLEVKDTENMKYERVLNTFYLMDNFNRGDRPAFMTTHFSSRFAFWSNVLFALAFLAIFRIFIQSICDYIGLILILSAFLAWYFADEYFKAYYDTILRVYYMKSKDPKDIFVV